MVTFFDIEEFDVFEVGGAAGACAFLGLAFLTFLLADDEGLEEVLEVDVWAVDCFLGDFEVLEEEISLG